jgi:5-methylcytosine-specific restriction enzyme subunit McrC
VINQAVTVIELIEHRPTLLPARTLSEEQGETLAHLAGKQIDVQYPSPRTNHQWELTSQGYVGVLAVDSTLSVVVRPKVPIANLGRMLAEAYDLPVHDFPGLTTCSTLEALYDQLARMLALGVLGLARQGLHQRYQPRSAPLSAVRGRIVFTRPSDSVSDVRLSCRFSERTGDILENRIPLATIDRILRSGLCGDPTSRLLREAHRHLSNSATHTRVTLQDCTTMRFDRLTERYRPVVALCRLFIESAGPTAQYGTADTVPFLLSMPLLFERYVARWLTRRCNCDGEFQVRSQERNVVGDNKSVEFFIDLVVYDVRTDQPICVLDTKYKNVDAPASADVAQVGYYALLKGANLACLIYPTRSLASWVGSSGKVRTYRGGFDLDYDLAESGESFFQDLKARIEERRS